MKRRINRDFRNTKSPAKFLALCRRIRYGLTDNHNLPESVFGLLQQYFDLMDLIESTYQLSLDGGRASIRQREKLSQEIVVLLDQIASLLEAAFILNPDALLTTGFTISQERRSSNRVKLPLAALTDFSVVNSSERYKALGSASPAPGTVVYEIHINLKDPSVEADWFHKAIFHDPQNMVMDDLAAGNICFRVRPHGPDGAGPWSGIVTTTIT
jgi:hypothetical protein